MRFCDGKKNVKLNDTDEIGSEFDKWNSLKKPLLKDLMIYSWFSVSV